MAENYIWFSAILIIFWLMERKTMDAYEIGVKVENLVWEIKDNLRTQIEKELKEELKTTLKAELTIGIIVRMLKKNKYTLEEIAEYTDYPLEQIKKIKEDFICEKICGRE